MRLESEDFTRDWADAAASLDGDTLAAILHKVQKLAHGRDDDAADALPRAVLSVAGGQRLDPACIVAVGCAVRDRVDAERAADALAFTLATLAADGTPGYAVAPTPTYESVRPILTASQRTMLDGLAAHALTTSSGVNYPDAPRALRATVLADALGIPRPRKAVETAALLGAGCAAWVRVSEVITPGPETREERSARVSRYVGRRKSTHTGARSESARGRLKATNPNPMHRLAYVVGVDPETREKIRTRAAALGVPMSALSGHGATFVAVQDGVATRALGYRPARAVKYAPNPAPTLKGVGEGMPWGGAGAHGQANRETPDALAGARAARAAERDDASRAATVNADTLASINGPRPLWATGPGAWVPSGSAPTLVFPTFGVGGSHVRGTFGALIPTPPAPAPAAPERDGADAFRPCTRPVPSTGADAAPDAPGCGCGARRPGAVLAADGAHRLVPCESPNGERCGCKSKAGRLVVQDGTPSHAPRVRRRR